MSKIAKDLSELQFYVGLLEDIKGKKKYSNFELLEKDLLIEFGIKTDRKQLNELYEPTIEEHATDLKILMNNVG